MVTLPRLLELREARWAQRLALAERGTVLSLTTNAPGPDKWLPAWTLAWRIASDTLAERFGSVLLEDVPVQSDAGPERHVVVALAPREAKVLALEIEDGPLGRLVDLDVLGPDGPVGRTGLGLPPRRCLCCDQPAKECAALARHDLGELIAAADRLVSQATDHD